MQKCPRCKFRKVETHQIRDDDDRVIMVQDICTNCDVVIKEKTLKKRRYMPWRK